MQLKSRIVAAVLALISLALMGGVGPAFAAPEKPNILFIFGDDVGIRKIKITNKAPEILFLEAKDGVQTAAIKVNKVGARLSTMVITASIPANKGVSMQLDKNRERELAVRITTNVCEALNQNCQLVQQ